ncbi:MAG TPA: marine proteobacterial sortase target protein [Burkholderiales bacterium]
MQTTEHHPKAALPLIALLTLASALGVTVAIILAGLTMLLAAPAYAEPARTKEAGFFLRSRGGDPVAAPLLATDVAFRVSGPIARARVVQTFRNPHDAWYEGVYVFPLPESGAVDRLVLRIGTRVVEGEIRERELAKQAYAQARAAGQRAALLDQARPNIFSTNVANIAPGETVVVELEYQQVLRYDNGRFSLRFPMVVGPRYIPTAAVPVVADAHRITPPVMRPGTEGERTNPVSIRVTLDAGVPLATVESAYHPIDVKERDDSRREIMLADAATPGNRDFELAWVPRQSALPQAAWFTERVGADHYALLMLLPPEAARAPRLPREVVFVLDTSGSMAGASIRQAKEALELALGRLGPQDRFEVIEFNSGARALFNGARDAGPDNLRAAVRWVRALEARGGTEMAAALRLALDDAERSSRVRQVVFLTDGAVGNEEGLFRLIRERLGDSRLFTVGIGSAPNSHFMTKAAQLGGGTFTYIGRIEEVRAKMGELFAKLEAPVLKDVQAHWPEGVQVEAWPARLPDLYAGEPLVLVARLDKLDGELRVRGQRDGSAWEARVPLEEHAAATGLGSVWAREKITALVDSLREGASETVVRSRVIELAQAHRLVTRYTSFVAVDKPPVRASEEALKLAEVPTLLPEGWQYDKVFGELPRGATDSRRALFLGMLALLLAVGALRLRAKPW